MNKIAVLYICTGKYSIFWEGFYKSCQENFLPNCKKHYFVFTNSKDLTQDDDVTILHKEPRGFPLDSLFRFEMFLEIENLLLEYDYLFFFNSNMLLVNIVSSDILDGIDNVKSGLLGVIHPGYYQSKSIYYPYERNRSSSAYIPKKKADYKYYMGSLFGGTSEAFLKLCNKCSERIQSDLEQNYIARYHDESHLNKYFYEHSVFCLDSSYAFPEDSKLQFIPKIIIRDKTKEDAYFIKIKSSILQKIKRRLNMYYNVLIWR